MKSLFSSHFNWVEKAMDLHLVRQNIVASNLANINTPGYKAKKVEFEEELQAMLKAEENKSITRTNPKHLPVAFDPNKVSPTLLKSLEPRVVQGEDSVDLDKEMALMAKNAMIYDTLAQVMKKGFEGMKSVITEGSK
ncbi:MAG: flagellar basal-body rod protein FlgB [Desulfonauticus sp.]|jgi:flagellar basal-body rod protein FlgB|nr:MAG: Flagellar basal body rod protein FlgB [Desulfonauticus sp. 38_4375]MDK2922320.1 flagellar basal-body rod protein FlgB [Desulfonauticus sp.]